MPPLQGCTIAMSGTFPGLTQTAIQARLKSLGAEFSKSITTETTLLITTAKDLAKNTTKVKAALDLDLPLVSIDWLEECESTQAKADEKKYSLAGGSSQSSVPSQPRMTAKRPASPSPAPAVSTTSSAPAAKKLKSSKIVESTAQIGDGTNAKSSKLQIPLDEYCPLSNHQYQVYVSEDGTIYDASLNQTNASNNNNKFYRIQVSRIFPFP